jgi:predicted esterase
MEIRRTYLFVVAGLVFVLAAQVSTGVPDAAAGEEKIDLKIHQTEKSITVDGDLSDWNAVQDIAINKAPDGREIAATADISVAARFAYDTENFYAAVKVLDDTFEFPNRSWRYGDGFYLTFVHPSPEKSNLFYTFGVSLEKEKKTRVLVNRDGQYFPPHPLRDFELEIIQQIEEKTLTYELAIPWDYLLPLKPLFHETWGLNLIYVDRDNEQRENILQLFPDQNYDSELIDKRKGALVTFIPHTPKEPEFQSMMSSNFYYDDAAKIIRLAAHSPYDTSGWKVRYIMTSGGKNLDETKDIELEKGITQITYELPEGAYSTGAYDITSGVFNDKGALRYNQNHTFYVLNRNKEKEWASKLEEFKTIERAGEVEAVENSLPNLEIRLDWVKEYMRNAPPFASFDRLDEWQEEIDLLIEQLAEGKPALFPKGSVARLAHRSKIDNTLQPYSLYVPQGYLEDEPIPLLVTLHGSGVDEQQLILSVARLHSLYRSRKRTGTMMVMAPQARGLSDWYTGRSGEDVIECIAHVRKLYNIDEERIVLDGFSMGGYGAWRIGLLHPELFRALIIRSGAIKPPPPIQGENIIELLDRVKTKVPPVLILHGDKDNAVPVENASRAVEKLKELGIKHRYIEVKGAAHSGYERWDELFRWLNDVLGWR